MPRRRLIQAVNDALFEEMERDPKVIVYGEDVELAIIGDMRGLHERFGPDRVRNTPISEATLTGMAVGLAAAGYRPVLHLMFSNFIYTGMDAIGNQMAKLRLMTGGQIKLPITVIASFGGGACNAAQHSDSAYPVLMNMGGIKVLVPTNSADAKGLLKSAIRDDNPCFFLEPSGRGGDMGMVPDEEYLLPIGEAALLTEGDQATVVAIGRMVKPALATARKLAERGIAVDVIDPRTLVPLDEARLLASVGKTGRLVIVDEARECCGAASQIAAVVAERGFTFLKGPIRRVTPGNVAMPYAANAEAHLLPDEGRIMQAVLELVGQG